MLGAVALVGIVAAINSGSAERHRAEATDACTNYIEDGIHTASISDIDRQDGFYRVRGIIESEYDPSLGDNEAHTFTCYSRKGEVSSFRLDGGVSDAVIEQSTLGSGWAPTLQSADNDDF